MMQELTDKHKDRLFKTMIFSENMGDAYSDSSKLDNWIKTIDSHELVSIIELAVT